MLVKLIREHGRELDGWFRHQTRKRTGPRLSDTMAVPLMMRSPFSSFGLALGASNPFATLMQEILLSPGWSLIKH